MFNKNKCVSCGAILNEDASFCTKCGTPVPDSENNECTNPSCIRFKTNFKFGPEDLYCDKCGRPTTLGKQVDDLI